MTTSTATTGAEARGPLVQQRRNRYFERRPVIIDITTRHVVWVDGDDQAEALANAERNPFWELIKDGETSVSQHVEMKSPDQYDWDDVYSWDGPSYDHHVQLHRAELNRREFAARKVACAAAGHPRLHAQYRDDPRRWCPDCGEDIVLETVAVPAVSR